MGNGALHSRSSDMETEIREVKGGPARPWRAQDSPPPALFLLFSLHKTTHCL